MEQCKFNDAILFSHAPAEGPFRAVKIDEFNSSADYQVFRLKRLPELVDTAFVLSIEWDGYVIDPRAWNTQFREYDYIGAKWPHFSDGMNVGNSGFCLQSRKLLNALTHPRFSSDGSTNVDALICRVYRPILERDYGIRFAPESIADLFSYENSTPANPTFGFHGCGNMWRYTDDGEMIDLIDLLHPYVIQTGHYAGLVLHYYFQRKFVPLEKVYSKMRQYVSRDEALEKFKNITNSQALADEVLTSCERLLGSF